MERAQAILAELKRRGSVDPEVGFDAVIAGLAEGQPAVSPVARDRHKAQSFVRFSAGDAELLKELTAIRGLRTWPWTGPTRRMSIRVGSSRTSSGRQESAWYLSGAGTSIPTEGFWICDYSVDGEADRGSIGDAWTDDDPEGNLVRLADRLVEESLSEVIWGGWPLYPRHPTRPMWPMISAGVASWVCEADSADHVQIGHLGA